MKNEYIRNTHDIEAETTLTEAKKYFLNIEDKIKLKDIK